MNDKARRLLTKGAIVLFLWLVAIPATVVWSVHYGSPQAVWFWCEMLKWCTP